MSSSAGLVSGADVEREVGVTQFPAYGGEDEPTLATGDASLMRRGGGVPERAPLLQAHSRRSSGTSSDGQSTTKVAGEDELDLEALNALPWWKRPSVSTPRSAAPGFRLRDRSVDTKRLDPVVACSVCAVDACVWRRHGAQVEPDLDLDL